MEDIRCKQANQNSNSSNNFEIENGFKTKTPRLFVLPTPAIPKINVEKTIGITIILIRLIKILPNGVRTLFTILSLISGWLCKTAPTTIPRIKAIKICHARLNLKFFIRQSLCTAKYQI